MSANKKSGAKTSAFNGIAVANSMFACLPCDEEAEIKKKNRGVKKREQEDKPQPKKNDNNSAQQKNKNKNSVSYGGNKLLGFSLVFFCFFILPFLVCTLVIDFSFYFDHFPVTISRRSVQQVKEEVSNASTSPSAAAISTSLVTSWACSARRSCRRQPRLDSMAGEGPGGEIFEHLLV